MAFCIASAVPWPFLILVFLLQWRFNSSKTVTFSKLSDQSQFLPDTTFNKKTVDAAEEPFQCEFYNPDQCNSAETACDVNEICEKDRTTSHSCYSLWTNSTSDGVKVLFKGCWNTHPDCRKDECIATRPQTSGTTILTYFCCCLTSNCNEKIDYVPEIEAIATELIETSVAVSDRWFNAVLYAFVPVCLLALVIFAVYWCYRRQMYLQFVKNQIVSDTNGKMNGYANAGPLRPITLIDVKAKGRFGCVWMAKWSDRIVAVKTFPQADEESWLREQEIYAVPGLRRHPNILEFLAAEVRGSGMETEFWLITAYHEHGSLFDYLKTHELDAGTAICISLDILRGLSFLHEERLNNDGCYKPSIAHRDFKSRNVLLKQDGSACVADFGLSIKCEHGQAPTDTHGQVGTHRYMAPEVLEGACEFTAFAFRQIDVYAASLVLWEVLSRTKFGNTVVDDYRLPYEEDLGARPSVTDVQKLIVEQKHRPKLKELWRKDAIFCSVCSTLEEMWDSEPEARITSGCAFERFNSFASCRTSHPISSLSSVEPEAVPLMGNGYIATIAESNVV